MGEPAMDEAAMDAGEEKMEEGEMEGGDEMMMMEAAEEMEKKSEEA